MFVQELVAEGRLDPRMPVAESRRDRGPRTERPRIGLDPFGRGVEVVLPAIGDSPDGSAIWHITADGLTAHRLV